MRLHLSIQRHTLPIANIVWTIQGQDPKSTAPRASTTVSQLLQDINDVMQLETEDWGLEDYVVEVNGYECLHFQLINSVLKEDDEVTIRALLTNDLRARRLGGRHQITVDGRHLHDGVAFGRPYLRKTARPSLQIPPRKRRKLDVGSNEWIDEEPVTLENVPARENSDYSALVPHEDLLDFSMPNGGAFYHLPPQDVDFAGRGSSDSELDADFAGEQGSSAEDEENSGHSELSDVISSAVEVEFVALQSTGNEDRRPDHVLGQQLQHDGQVTRRRSQRIRDRGGCPEGESTETRHDAGQQLQLEYVSLSDIELRAAWDKGEASNEQQTSAVHSNESATSSDATFLGIVSHPLESEGNSLSTSSSSSASTSDSDSSAGLGSESDSDAESETESISQSVTGGVEERPFQDGLDNASSQQLRSCGVKRPAPAAPGQGLKRTQRNNKRIRNRKTLARLKDRGVLAPNADFAELSAYKMAQHQKRDARRCLPESERLELERQEILQQFLSPKLVPDGGQSQSFAVSDPAEFSPACEDPATSTGMMAEEIATSMPLARAKLDVSSSQRMVFRSLGVKVPATPDECLAMREKLASRSVKAAKNPTDTSSVETSGTSIMSRDKRFDWVTWRQMIDLSAEECEELGRMLSEPPFPFYQPWEQRSNTRSQANEHSAHTSHKSDSTSPTTHAPPERSSALGNDTVSQEIELDGDIQKQLTQEAQELSNREVAEPATLDLPFITDPSALETLTPEDAVVGSVIAFMQLEVSSDTGWRPLVSAYRTARVEEVLSDGTLRIILAKRDRIPEAILDENRWRNFYDFEMPFEETQDVPDAGFREILYASLIEPKMVEKASLEVSNGSTREHSQIDIASREQSSQVSGLDKSDDGSAEVLEVSIPRQKEIANIMKQDVFDSSLDSELNQPSPSLAATKAKGVDPVALAQASAKRLSRQTMNLDGASGERDPKDLGSPQWTPWQPHFERQGGDFYGGSGVFVPWPSSLDDRNRYLDDTPSVLEPEVRPVSNPAIQSEVVYPRLSQLVAHEASPSLANGKSQSPNRQQLGAVQSGQGSNHEADGMTDVAAKATAYTSSSLASTSYMDSLKSTDPAMTDMAPTKPRRKPKYKPSVAKLMFDSSSDSDIPSLSELTSTARSRKVSPPPLKRLGKGNGRGGVTRLKREQSSPELATYGHHRGLGTHTQSKVTSKLSSSLRSKSSPSQPPASSQMIDLTQCSSDAESSQHSEAEPIYIRSNGIKSFHDHAVFAPSSTLRKSQAKKAHEQRLTGCGRRDGRLIGRKR